MTNRLLVFLLPAIFLVTGCRPDSAKNTGQPIVTVSILPFRYFVEELAGDRFQVNVLVPPGASHHAYDPTPRQLKELEQSAALFIDGYLGFEQSWIPRLRQSHPDLAVIDLSRGIDLITIEGGEGDTDHKKEQHAHEHEGPDPHFWLSFTEAGRLAENMAAGLIQAEPESGEIITRNLKSFRSKLDSLHRVTRESLQALQHRSFIIYHPALNYYARDYGLVQYPMEQGGKEPSAAHFRWLVDQARQQPIGVILIQKEYDQENASALAREISASVRVIDPMSEKWESEMMSIAGKLQ